jgi:hypothetical protein
MRPLFSIGTTGRLLPRRASGGWPHPALNRALSGNVPPEALVAEIARLRRVLPGKASGSALSDAYREILRGYRALRTAGKEPSADWRALAEDALSFLGGQSDRLDFSLADYDHVRFGPFLGISNEGGGAATISEAAYATPKADALGDELSALNVGVAVDGEVLGGVGEVPVGPDEFADIWLECTGRTLMTTNVGARANLRLYRLPPVVKVAPDKDGGAPESAKTELADAFELFLKAPGGPRALTVFVEFDPNSPTSATARKRALQALVDYVAAGTVTAPGVQDLGLKISVGDAAGARGAVLEAIDLAAEVGISRVAIEGIVRREADRALSLPGLLDYFSVELTNAFLERAAAQGVKIDPYTTVDADTVARDIWSSLNTARAMGLHLGKYGLFPLTLDESEVVVGHVQRWFPDWTAAPVFYVDQGIVDGKHVYWGDELEEGVEIWLRLVARHKVRLVLIDTVDKALGWKILKTGGDDRGLLRREQIGRLNALAESLGVRVMWAGGLTAEEAYQLGELGVFGLYVTMSVSEPVPVGGVYLPDPALASQKRPTRTEILKVKTLVEAGFLAKRLAALPQTAELRDLLDRIAQAGMDVAALANALPDAWRAWWRLGPGEPRPQPPSPTRPARRG